MAVTEGIGALRRAQGSTPEATFGTAQAASTWTWAGVGINFIADERTIKGIPEKIGYYGETIRHKVVKAQGKLDFPATPLDIWAVPNMLRFFGGIGAATYTVDPAPVTATGWISKTALPTTVRPTIQTFTAQVGSDFEVWQSTGCFFEELKFSGKEEDLIMVAAKAQCRAPEYLGAAFNPVTPPIFMYNAVAVVPDTPTMGAMKFFIDPMNAANYGLTQVSDTLMDFEITYKLKVKPLFLNNATPVVTAAGQPGVTRFILTGIEITGKATYLYNATGGANTGQVNVFNTDTNQRLRFQAYGRPLSIAGTGAAPNTYVNQIVNWDVPAYYTGVKVGSRNDVDIVECNFKSNIDTANMTTPDAGFITTVVNGVHATAPTLP